MYKVFFHDICNAILQYLGLQLMIIFIVNYSMIIFLISQLFIWSTCQKIVTNVHHSFQGVQGDVFKCLTNKCRNPEFSMTEQRKGANPHTGEAAGDGGVNYLETQS